MSVNVNNYYATQSRVSQMSQMTISQKPDFPPEEESFRIESKNVPEFRSNPERMTFGMRKRSNYLNHD